MINAALGCVCNTKCSSIQSGTIVMMFAAYSGMHISCSSLSFFFFFFGFQLLKLCGPIIISSTSMFPAKNFIHWECHFNAINARCNSSSMIGHGLHRWPLAGAHTKFGTTVLFSIYVVDFFSCIASAANKLNLVTHLLYIWCKSMILPLSFWMYVFCLCCIMLGACKSLAGDLLMHVQ